MNVTEIQLCSNDSTDGLIVHATFALRNVNRSQPYIIKSVTGLDVDEIVKTYDDGPAFFRMVPKQRIVEFSIKANPDYYSSVTFGDLRDNLYRYITSNNKSTRWNDDNKLELRFRNGSTYIGSLFGFVTKVESESFTSDMGLKFTIDCPYPFIRSTVDLPLTINNSPGAPSHWRTGTEYTVSARCSYNDTKSTAPHGFKMVVEVLSNQSQFIIWDNRNPDYYLFFVYFSFLDGDIIHFSSEEDDQYIYYERSMVGYYIPLNNTVLWGSIWPYMAPGDNEFDISAGMSITEATFKETYWGV